MSYISPTVSILSELVKPALSSSSNPTVHLVGGTTSSSRLAHLGRQILLILPLLANSGLYLGNTAEAYLGVANQVQPHLDNTVFTLSPPTKTTPEYVNPSTTSPSLNSGGCYSIFQVTVFALVIISAIAYGVMITIKRSQRRHKRPVEESVKPPYREGQIVPPSNSRKDGNNKENGRSRFIGSLPPPASFTSNLSPIAQAPSAPPPPSQPPPNPNAEGKSDQDKNDGSGKDSQPPSGPSPPDDDGGDDPNPDNNSVNDQNAARSPLSRLLAMLCQLILSGIVVYALYRLVHLFEIRVRPEHREAFDRAVVQSREALERMNQAVSELSLAAIEHVKEAREELVEWVKIITRKYYERCDVKTWKPMFEEWTELYGIRVPRLTDTKEECFAITRTIIHTIRNPSTIPNPQISLNIFRKWAMKTITDRQEELKKKYTPILVAQLEEVAYGLEGLVWSERTPLWLRSKVQHLPWKVWRIVYTLNSSGYGTNSIFGNGFETYEPSLALSSPSSIPLSASSPLVMLSSSPTPTLTIPLLSGEHVFSLSPQPSFYPQSTPSLQPVPERAVPFKSSQKASSLFWNIFEFALVGLFVYVAKVLQEWTRRLEVLEQAQRPLPPPSPPSTEPESEYAGPPPGSPDPSYLWHSSMEATHHEEWASEDVTMIGIPGRRPRDVPRARVPTQERQDRIRLPFPLSPLRAPPSSPDSSALRARWPWLPPPESQVHVEELESGVELELVSAPSSPLIPTASTSGANSQPPDSVNAVPRPRSPPPSTDTEASELEYGTALDISVASQAGLEAERRDGEREVAVEEEFVSRVVEEMPNVEESKESFGAWMKHFDERKQGKGKGKEVETDEEHREVDIPRAGPSTRAHTPASGPAIASGWSKGLSLRTRELLSRLDSRKGTNSGTVEEKAPRPRLSTWTPTSTSGPALASGSTSGKSASDRATELLLRLSLPKHRPGLRGYRFRDRDAKGEEKSVQPSDRPLPPHLSLRSRKAHNTGDRVLHPLAKRDWDWDWKVPAIEPARQGESSTGEFALKEGEEIVTSSEGTELLNCRAEEEREAKVDVKGKGKAREVEVVIPLSRAEDLDETINRSRQPGLELSQGTANSRSSPTLGSSTSRLPKHLLYGSEIRTPPPQTLNFNSSSSSGWSVEPNANLSSKSFHSPPSRKSFSSRKRELLARLRPGTRGYSAWDHDATGEESSVSSCRSHSPQLSSSRQSQGTHNINTSGGIQHSLAEGDLDLDWEVSAIELACQGESSPGEFELDEGEEIVAESEGIRLVLGRDMEEEMEKKFDVKGKGKERDVAPGVDPDRVKNQDGAVNHCSRQLGLDLAQATSSNANPSPDPTLGSLFNSPSSRVPNLVLRGLEVRTPQRKVPSESSSPGLPRSPSFSSLNGSMEDLANAFYDGRTSGLL